MRRSRIGRCWIPVVLSLLALQSFGCALKSSPEPLGLDGRRALRIRDVAAEGDPQRRASTRLVLAGLAAEDPMQAVSHYERAIKTDATNPYAYLALAAYEVQWGDVDRGEQSLNQADRLLRSERSYSPRVDPHFDGLRGRVDLRRSDAAATNAAGVAKLDRARRAAPDVWGDGWLTPEELR